MKKYKVQSAFCMLLFSVLIAGCSSDKDEDTSETVIPGITVTINGQALGADFSGAVVKYSGAAAGETQVDNNGQFSIEIGIDDLVPEQVLVVDVTSVKDARIKYSALAITGDTEQVFAANASSFDGGVFSGGAVSFDDNSKRVIVSAVSTALHSLIVHANNGKAPVNLTELTFYEKSVDADALTQAAAIVKILTENPDIALPDGVNDFVELLHDKKAYDTIVKNVQQFDPQLIQQTVVRIIADPILTAPLSEIEIPELYVSTAAVAPGFLARWGERWQFNTDGSGNYAMLRGSYDFFWKLENGKLQLTYKDPIISNYAYSTSSSRAVGIAGVTQEQLDKLLAENYFMLEVKSSVTGEEWSRLTAGGEIDTYRRTRKSIEIIEPIKLSSGEEIATSVDVSNSFNSMMRKTRYESAIGFGLEDMEGLWAINSYYNVGNDEAHSFYLDLLQFNAGGNGEGTDTGRTFNWQITEGILYLTFSDGTKQSVQILDRLNNEIQILSTVSDSNDKMIAAQVDYAVKVDPEVSVTAENIINPEGTYWQTTIVQWQLFSWQQGKMAFCTDISDMCQTNFFGWQFEDSGLGNRAYLYDGIPPEFTPVTNIRTSLNWSVNTADNLVAFYYSPCSDGNGTCEYRTWKLLNIGDGLLGKRILVQETSYRRRNDQSEYTIIVGSRMNLYEQINYDYWNDISSEVDEK